MSDTLIRASARHTAFRTALLVSSAVSVLGANAALAQAVSQTSVSDLEYTAPTLSGAPEALYLESSGGNVAATVQTVTASGADGDVVSLKTAGGTITANIGSLTANGTGDIHGVRINSATGDANIAIGNLDITSASGSGINVFLAPGLDQYDDPLPGGGSLLLNINSIKTTGAEADALDGDVGGNITAKIGSITTTGAESYGFHLDAGGNISLEVGTIITTDRAIDSSAGGSMIVTTTGNITSGDQAISVNGADTLVNIGTGTTVTGTGDAIEADGENSLVINNKGTVVATGANGEAGQVAIRANSDGNVTIDSFSASSAANARQEQLDATIRGESGAGKVTITADTTSATGAGMSAIYGVTESGDVSINAKNSSSTGAFDGNHSADTVFGQSASGNVTVVSETSTNAAVVGSAVVAYSNTGSVSLTSGTATTTGGGGTAVYGFSGGGTATVSAGTTTALGVSPNPNGGNRPPVVAGAVAARGDKGASVTAGTTVSAGQAISATSNRGDATIITTGNTSSERGIAVGATGGNVVITTGLDTVTSTKGTVAQAAGPLGSGIFANDTYAISGIGRTGVTINNGGTAIAVGPQATINATTATGNTSVTSKNASNTGTGQAILAQAAQGDTTVVTSGTTSAIGQSAIIATGGKVTVATGADSVTSSTGAGNTGASFAILASGRTDATIVNGGTATSTGGNPTLTANAANGVASVTSKTAINNGNGPAIVAQSTLGSTVNSTTATAIGNAPAISATSTLGSVSVTSGDATAGGFSAIVAQALAQNNSSLQSTSTVVSTGTVLNASTVSGSRGILATGRDGATVTANNVEAQGSAIRAQAQSGNAAINVTGAITSRADNAISVGISRSFTIDIGANSVVTGNGGTAAVAGGSNGGDGTVNNLGKIVVRGPGETGIGITTSGNATVVSKTIDVSSDVAPTSTFNSGGISAVSSGGGNVSITSDTATVHGAGRYGIIATTSGTGTVSIKSNTVSNDADYYQAIYAGTDAGNITVDSGTVRAAGKGAYGINANSNSGNITVKSVDLATTGAEDSPEGILVNSNTGTVSVDSGKASAAGLNASAVAAIGGAGVTINSVDASNAGEASDVIYTSSANGDINIASGKVVKGAGIGAGISANAGGKVAINSTAIDAIGGINTVGIFATAAGDVSVKSGTIASTRYGISANSNGGNVSIATVGNTITGTNTNAATSFGIRGTGGVVSVTTAGTTSGGTAGIEAVARDSATVMNAGTVTASGDRASAIIATAPGAISITSTTATLTGGGADPGVSNAGLTNGYRNLRGAIVANGTDGAITITSDKVDVAGEYRYGIAATSNGSISVTSKELSLASTDSAGIRIYGGAGSVTVDSAKLTTTGNGTAGIVAGTTSGDITIKAGDTTTLGKELASGNFSADAVVGISQTGKVTITSLNARSDGAIGSAVYAVGGSADVTSGTAVINGSGGSGVAAIANTGDAKLVASSTTHAGTTGQAIAVRSVTGKADAAIGTVSAINGTTTGVAVRGATGAAVTSNSIASAGTALAVQTSGVGAIAVTSKDIATTANGAAGIYARAVDGPISIVSTGNVTTKGNVVVVNNVPQYAAGIWAQTTGTGTATITNSGSIAASGQAAAIRIDGGSGATIVNAAGASLKGATAVFSGAAGTLLTNEGSITGAVGPAIVATGKAYLINSGTILGAGTPTNPTPIAAILSAADDTVELRTGSAVTGVLVGGAGVDTLLLKGASATKTDAQTVAETGQFEILDVNSGYWTAKGYPSFYAAATIQKDAVLELQPYLIEGEGYSPVLAEQVINNGQIVLNSNTGTVVEVEDGINISGAGSLRINGGDTILVSGSGLSYTGGTTVEKGTLQLTGAFGGDIAVNAGATFRLGDGTTSGTFTGNLVDNGTFIYDRIDNYTIAGNFTGNGQLTKNGAGTLTFGGTYGFTGTTTVNGGAVKFTGQLAPTTELDLKSGTVDLSSVSGGTQTVAELQGTGGQVALGSSNLTINQGTNTSFAGGVTGTGGLTKTGSGTLDLTGTSTYTGATNVSGGTLKVNGSIANSTVVVGSGGTLGGNGTVGGINAQGGTLSPGNSIGRLTVNGNIVLNASSTYLVEANNQGQADRVDATGTAALGGARVAVTAIPGIYRPETNYTILTAAGGVSGTFGSVTSSLAFLSPSLSYSTNAVTLKLTRNNIAFAAAGRNANERAVGAEVQALGAGNPLFEAALTLTDAGVSPAFGSLAGQITASLGTGFIEGTQPIRTLLNEISVGEEGRGVFAWGNVLGNSLRFDAAGANERLRADQAGVMTGLGYGANGFVVGAGIGYTDPNYRTNTATADVESVVAAGFVGYDAGDINVKLGASYAWHRVDQQRTASIGTINNVLTSEIRARTSQMFANISYDIAAGNDVVVTPIAGLAYVNTGIDGYTERGGPAALRVRNTSRGVGYTTLGLGVKGTGNVRPFANAAWRYAFGDTAGVSEVGFANAQGRFGVASTSVVTNAADFNGGFEFNSERFSVSASAGGVVGKNFSNTGVKLTAGVRF